MSAAEKLLRVVLVLCGVACLCGLPGLYMPRSWMAAAHEWLGMGAFPEQPIAEYLARQTSGLYAMYGALVCVMATDVRRFARLITAQAVAILALSVSALVCTWSTGIPKWWLLGDVGSAAGFALAVLALQRAAAGRAAGRATEVRR